MTYTLPTWVDGSTPLDSANFGEYNTAINDLDTRVASAASTASTANATATAAAAAAAANVNSVTAGDSSITVAGTATAPTVKVAQANLTVAQSQITGLTTALNNSMQQGGIWDFNTFGDLMSNMCRDDAINTAITMGSTPRTHLVLVGLTPTGSYSVFRLCVTTGQSGGVITAALFGSTSLTSTSWSRLGSGNATVTVSASGVVTTSLPFTLATPTYVLLELVSTTTFTTYPTFAVSVGASASLINPSSGAPVTGTTTNSSAPGSTLNPTTGVTNITQKPWVALA